MNSTKARSQLQLLLAVARTLRLAYGALIALVEHRKLISRLELEHWAQCANDLTKPSPVECPAWGVYWDSEDEAEDIEEVLGLVLACTNEACDHNEDIAALRERLARRMTQGAGQ